MRIICLALLFLVFPGLAFANVTFQLCNSYGIKQVHVLAKDKKKGMSIIYNSIIQKNGCQSVASATSDDHAEIELKIDQGQPYGVPWISPGDKVNF